VVEGDEQSVGMPSRGCKSYLGGFLVREVHSLGEDYRSSRSWSNVQGSMHRIPGRVVGRQGTTVAGFSCFREQSRSCIRGSGRTGKMRLELDPEAHMLLCIPRVDSLSILKEGTVVRLRGKGTSQQVETKS